MTHHPWTRTRVIGLALSLACSAPAAADKPANVPVEAPPAPVTAETTRTDDSAAFTIQVGDEIVPYPVFGVYVMPGAQRIIRPVLDAPAHTFRVAADSGTLQRLTDDDATGGQTAWRWTAPETPGPATLTVQRQPDGAVIRLNAFVMTPAAQVADGRLNGYEIGDYPAQALRGRAIYTPPDGFVEVTARTEDLRVSPHFRLGEFVAKQAGDHPKYVVLRERLLLKLEMIIEQLTAAGYPATGLHIMSGYRTPHYNRTIGNVPYSRHVWGGAADIFVDEAPRDGNMDDLDGDGRITKADARVLYDLIDGLTAERWYQPFIGGMGLYGPKPGVRGPFVHVDVRGYRARW